MKRFTVYRTSHEFEVAYVDAETADEAQEAAENDPRILWRWAGNDDVEITVEASEPTPTDLGQLDAIVSSGAPRLRTRP